LTHDFTCPASIDDVWATFNDLEVVASCFPGASLTSYDGESFDGLVKVKLGPISLQYAGTGRFVDRDEAAHRAVIEAKGRDKRGNGTAAASVTTTLASEGESSTRVSVVTDLKVTGKPAQFGRGVMQDVSDRLLAQFTACLETKLSQPAAAPSEGENLAEADQPSEAVVDESEEARHRGEPPAAALADGESGAHEHHAPLDLAAALLPVLVKRYALRIVAGLAAIWLLRRLLRRRR
jgi:carbon monoxide dehydrogenase subunit G